ncbi:MAG: TadE family protein [bacterium]
MKFKNYKAQAITEFVMVLPILIMLMAGLCQMSIIMIRRIELSMVEREVMRYLTADSEDKDKVKVEAFLKEYAGKLGMNPQKISYRPQGRFVRPDKTIDELGLLENVSGVIIHITYEQKLMKAFAAITQKQTIILSTTLSSAAGLCMKFKINEKAKEVWGNLIKGGDSAYGKK